MRLISYNIHKGIGVLDRLCRLERICEVMEREKPDLFCLQEVTHQARRTHSADQCRILIDYFRACDSHYQMNVHYRVGGYGNLMLSRWPFLSRHNISLRLGERKPRGAQTVVVDTPEGRLHLVNWHLGLTQKEQNWQAEHLLRHRLFQESIHLPTMIVGDCNDWRDRLAKKPFAMHGYHSATGSEKRFKTFPAFRPMLSLDKVFHRGAIVVKHARVVRSDLAHRASDHLPLVVDFHLGAFSDQPSAFS